MPLKALFLVLSVRLGVFGLINGILFELVEHNVYFYINPFCSVI